MANKNIQQAFLITEVKKANKFMTMVLNKIRLKIHWKSNQTYKLRTSEKEQNFSDTLNLCFWLNLN